MRFFLAGILIFLFSVGSSSAEGEKFFYDANGRRDPLWSLVSPSGAIINYETDLLLIDLALEGVMYGPEGKSLAIINGKIVKERETVGQFEVFEIRPETVVLKKDGQRFELKLKKGE